MRSLFLILISVFYLSACNDHDGNQNEFKACYICTHNITSNPDCSSSYEVEVCVKNEDSPSFQDVLLITKRCDGEMLPSQEKIEFLESFLQEQMYAGADCVEK